jgi:hypothetical protein
MLSSKNVAIILFIATIFCIIVLSSMDNSQDFHINSTYKSCTIIYEVKKGQTLQEVIDFNQVYSNSCLNKGDY